MFPIRYRSSVETSPAAQPKRPTRHKSMPGTAARGASLLQARVSAATGDGDAVDDGDATDDDASDVRRSAALHNIQGSPSSSDSSSVSGALAAAAAASFDFEKMTASFEQIERDFLGDHHALPRTARFVGAMREVVKLFETLGSAFTFVKRDIDSKLDVLAEYERKDAAHYDDLNTAVGYEVSRAIVRIKSPASCARTLLRLMWAVKFADRLLDGLACAFNAESALTPSERTLRWAVARAYDDALAEHHSWTMRRAVRSACVFLPSKEAFIERLGVCAEDRDDFLQRLSVSMSPLVRRMYEFYDELKLLDLP